LQSELNSTIASEVNDVNRILTSIADLNKQIFEIGYSNASDLLDKRTEAYKELSAR
jgi:flagellar hook-associated protein FlgK